MAKRKTKKHSYVIRKKKHISKKLSNMFNRKRTHKKRKIKAKGLRNILFRRRTTLRNQQQIARQQRMLQIAREQRLNLIEEILQELEKTNSEMHATKFKTWLNRGKDWDKWQKNHSINNQFENDRGRITFIINRKIKDLGRKSLTKDKAIECIKKTQKTKEETKYLLLWGTQLAINWINTYISELIKNFIIKKHGTRFEQPIMQSRIKSKDVAKKAEENDINTCVNYENKRITLIHDFLISDPEEDGIEGSITIEIESPFKIDNINNISISRHINQCGNKQYNKILAISDEAYF